MRAKTMMAAVMIALVVSFGPWVNKSTARTNGATLRPDDDANKDMYGKEMSNKDVVLGNMKPPRAADRLIAELNKHSSRRASD